MATKLLLPKLGQTMEQGAIVEWLKKEGDPVARGDVLYTLESDKAVLEVEAKVKGTLLKILVEAGVTVPVLVPVGIVGTPGEDITALLGEGGVAAVAGQEAGAPGEGAPSGGAASGGAPWGGADGAAGREAGAPEEGAPGEGAPWGGADGVAGREAGAPGGGAPEEGAPGEDAPGGGAGRVFSSPRARKVAAEQGIDLTVVKGSGPEGRIVEADVRAWAERQPAATPLAQRVARDLGVSLEGLGADGGRVTAEQVRVAGAPAPATAPATMAPPAPASAPVAGKITPMAGIRKVIAERMATSSQTTAAVTLDTEVDATEFVALRTMLKDALAQELGFSLGYNDLMAYIVARCLGEFPYVNVKLTAEGIVHQTSINVGMAVDSEAGLLVPVIKDADKKSLKALAVEFRQLVERARVGKAQPDDLRGGTFTITNLGMFGIDSFSPIINLPECAILGVGRIKAQPAVVDGQVAVRQMMWLSLTFDHRLVDGAPAARFLQRIAQYIESPYLLLA